MSGIAVFLGVILLVLATAFSLYVRWWIGRAVQEKPQIEVHVSSDKRATRVRLTTRGTRRQFRLTRITAMAPVPKGAVDLPEGFREVKKGRGAGIVNWTPKRPVILPPGFPFEFHIAHGPGDGFTLEGEVESKLGIGGTKLRFAILVREQDPERREYFNRRSAVYAAAAERGVPPRKLPGWKKVRAMEERLGERSSPSDE